MSYIYGPDDSAEGFMSGTSSVSTPMGVDTGWLKEVVNNRNDGDSYGSTLWFLLCSSSGDRTLSPCAQNWDRNIEEGRDLKPKG